MTAAEAVAAADIDDFAQKVAFSESPPQVYISGLFTVIFYIAPSLR